MFNLMLLQTLRSSDGIPLRLESCWTASYCVMFQHLISVIWFYGLHDSLQRDVVLYSDDWKVWVCTGSGHLLLCGRPEWAATSSFTGKSESYEQKEFGQFWICGLQYTLWVPVCPFYFLSQPSVFASIVCTVVCCIMQLFGLRQEVNIVLPLPLPQLVKLMHQHFNHDHQYDY